MEKFFLTDQQESETLEFKESTSLKEEAGKDMCAFANKNGGTVYFGVKNNGDILGLQDVNEKTIRELSIFFGDNIQPKLYPVISIESFEGKSVIKIEVAKSSTPYHAFRHIMYVRVGSASHQVPQSEYKKRLINYEGTNLDFSAQKIAQALMDDLSISAIKELRRLLAASGRFQQDINGYDDNQLLKNLQLTQDGQLTVAALVLLGTEEGLAKHLPYAEIRYGYRLSENEIRNQDSAIFRGGYLLYYDKLWQKIDSRNITLNIPHGLFLSERKAFEEETIREALNNAVIHRDYQEPETVFVFQHQTSIEIKSPGGFLEGITLENIIHESKVRNKLIADILYRCEFVEQFGTGVRLMYRNQLTLGKALPDYTYSQQNRVILRLDGAIQDIEFARYVLKVANEKQRQLGDQELLLLYKIKNGDKVSQIEAKNLVELGLIEKLGYGKWNLSKQYYIDTKQKGKYTRRKGLDIETNKELILKHLKEFPEGAKKQDLQEVLPQLGWIQIWRLLKGLRRENKIIFTGDRRSKSGVYKLI